MDYAYVYDKCKASLGHIHIYMYIIWNSLDCSRTRTWSKSWNISDIRKPIPKGLRVDWRLAIGIVYKHNVHCTSTHTFRPELRADWKLGIANTHDVHCTSTHAIPTGQKLRADWPFGIANTHHVHPYLQAIIFAPTDRLELQTRTTCTHTYRP